MRGLKWWVLALVTGLLLASSAGGFWWLRRPRPPRAQVRPPPPPPAVPCPGLELEPGPMLPDAEATPVVVGLGAEVRAQLDGAPLPAPVVTLSPGVHTLRAEAPPAAPLELHFRLDAFRPALLHVERTGEAGLTAVFLGARCDGCAPSTGRVSLEFTRTPDADAFLLGEAAHALRGGTWQRAAARLRGVSPASRHQTLFTRLAAAVLQSSGQSAEARAQVAAQKELQPLLAKWDGLVRSELERAGGLGLKRWNLLTEKFSALLEKFAREAPGPVQLSTSRLAELSAGFLEATQKKDPAAQDETVAAGTEALRQFVHALRRSRPDDCEFQSRISSSL